METVVSPPDPNALELRLLTEWEDEGAGRRRRRAGTLSILIHVAAIVTLALLPGSLLEPVRQAVIETVTPLIAPPMDVTQPTPNKGPLNKEVTAESLEPRPRIAIPPSPPSTTRPAARVLALPAPAPVPAPPVMAPPTIAANVPPPPSMNPLLEQPRVEPVEKPKIVLETPGAESGPAGGQPTGRVPMPGSTVQDAMRSVVRGGSGGGLTIGDSTSEAGVGGLGPGMNLPPSPGRRASNLQLLSDPLGVDFRPYLIAVLNAVRRNWFAVMPESARLGLRGRVSVQFAIARDGSVPKLVIVGPSGIDAFDRAAVAGVSASNPFPPLPTEFKGDQVRLQLNFTYNITRN